MDVVLVLLIIFMVVTPLLEKDIEVRVPETEKVETPPRRTRTTSRWSCRSARRVSTPSTPRTSPPRTTSRACKKMLNAKKKEDRVVFFMADDKASYGKLVAALDGAKQAGAKVLGFATEIPEGAVLPGAPGAAPVDSGAPRRPRLRRR